MVLCCGGTQSQISALELPVGTAVDKHRRTPVARKIFPTDIEVLSTMTLSTILLMCPPILYCDFRSGGDVADRKTACFGLPT
jgi:hypothetical protein